MIRRAITILGTAVLAGGFAAAMPVFTAILAATMGTLTVVGVYVLRLLRRRKRAERR